MASNPINVNIMNRAHDFYAVYCAFSDGVNFQNKPCPTWKELPEKIKENWYGVALRSLQLQLSDESAEHLGEESTIIPNTYVFGHLGDDRVQNAVVTWTEYSR